MSYDDIISDPKKVLEKIADFCDLPMPTGKLPKLDDDRSVAKPYLKYLIEAKGLPAE